MPGLVKCKLSLDELPRDFLPVFPHLEDQSFSWVVIVVRLVLLCVNFHNFFFLGWLVPQGLLVLSVGIFRF